MKGSRFNHHGYRVCWSDRRRANIAPLRVSWRAALAWLLICGALGFALFWSLAREVSK
jgi:hypothetical protein